MSAPLLITEPILSTTESNPFQIATPFSYTIVNEGPVSAGFELTAPDYIVPTGGSTGGSGSIQPTTGATFVSRADSNTNVIVTPTNQPYIATMLEGIQYYTSNDDMTGGERFLFSLPVSQYTGCNQAGSGSTSHFTAGVIEFLSGLTIEFITESDTGGDIYIPSRNFSANYKLGSLIVHTFNGNTNSFDVALTMPGEASIPIVSNYGLPFGFGPKFLLQELYWSTPSTEPPPGQTFPQAYSDIVFYNTDDIVFAFDQFWISTIDANYGNRPDISYPFWMSTPTPGNISQWNSSVYYTINQIVFVVVRTGDVYDDRGNLISKGGDTLVYYISLQDSNLNNPPATSPDWWAEGTTPPIPEPPTFSNWNSNTVYSIGDYAKYSNFNYVSLLDGYSNIVPSSFPDSWALISNTAPVFSVLSPVKITNYPPGFPELKVGSLTSPEVLPFLTVIGGYQINFESLTGFQSAPLSNRILQIVQEIAGNTIQTTSYTINVTPITITVTPELDNPLSNITYRPFSYLFSIPTDVVNVVLRANTLITSSNLIPYLSYDGSFIATFNSDIGLTSSGVTILELDAVLNGNTIIASNVTSINTISTNIIVEPPIPTGSLSLFKFEPFGYRFITNSESSGLVLRFTRSSSELQPFCILSDEGQTITFQGTFNISFSTRLSLVIDLMFGDTIVESLTILITVGQARFFPPAANQNFQLFQYENVSNTFGSNPIFSTALSITSIVSVPSLPSGLTFGGSCNSFFIQGTPLLQVPQSNYQVIGSNSSNGRIATVIISIKVNPQLVRINPSLSTLSGLTVDVPISPIVLSAFQPETIYATEFQYTWSGLPSGFEFQDLSGSNVSVPYNPPDTSLSIILTGAPTIAFANSVAASGSNLYQMRLFGTQIDQTGRRTIGSALFNFSFSETVLINVSNSVLLYQSKPLGATDVIITAGSFFSSSTISNITSESLPPGLSLVQYTGPTVYRLTGTPTEVNLTGSYTFTATNFNGNSRSIAVTIPVYPDIVSFGGSTPPNGSVISFIVSRPLTNPKIGFYTTPIVFTATSTSESIPIVYSSSIDLEYYGLVLNSSTGTLTGIPTISLTTTNVTIIATDALGTIGTISIELTILADVFEWPTYQPSYFQNRAITPFQFAMVSTLSERSIQSFSSGDLPPGLSISSAGLLTGTPTEFPLGGTGSFTIVATTGYSTLSQLYTYSMIADQLLIVQTNGSDIIERVFSGIAYQAIQYSTDSLVNATFTIGEIYAEEPLTISVTSGGLVSGNFTFAVVGSTYSVPLTATFAGVTTTTTINILFSETVGTIYIPTELSELTFIQPTQSSFSLFQYVSYSFPIQASGSTGYIYYYTSTIPVGFEFIKDSAGVSATLSGVSSTLIDQQIVIYAKTAEGYPVSFIISFKTFTPFFIYPQLGAGAYTAMLRNDVEGNAAQNARDNRVFPKVNPLAGPLMAPRAPDVVTPNDCILKLCKKPCPTCRTMM